ncbi:hypothetical protein F2Q69_00028951 [Brassica cretica]|uniref:Uncharacterized protein n=1 Tax=Brassica cretica TaxID=69181 RepID=A0A8S9S3Z2_BRACR|nr:hypothetical protein F2Q69_00028951 [Brassica cretica]
MISPPRRNHLTVVVHVRRQCQRVSRISATVEKRIPSKMTADIRAMANLCTTGTGPRERPHPHWIGRTARRMLIEMAAIK